MEGLRLINYINKFDQWMIMEMISSNERAKLIYCLTMYMIRQRDYRPEENKSI